MASSKAANTPDKAANDTAGDIEPLLTVDEIADTFRVSRRTVHRLVRSGELPSVTIGARRLFRRSDIAAIIAARQS